MGINCLELQLDDIYNCLELESFHNYFTMVLEYFHLNLTLVMEHVHFNLTLVMEHVHFNLTLVLEHFHIHPSLDLDYLDKFYCLDMEPYHINHSMDDSTYNKHHSLDCDHNLEFNRMDIQFHSRQYRVAMVLLRSQPNRLDCHNHLVVDYNVSEMGVGHNCLHSRFYFEWNQSFLPLVMEPSSFDSKFPLQMVGLLSI